MTERELVKSMPPEAAVAFLLDVLEMQNKKHEESLAQLNQTIANLNETIEQLRRMIFSSRSEKAPTVHIHRDENELGQMDFYNLIFNEAESAVDPSVQEPVLPESAPEDELSSGPAKRRKKKADHKTLYDKLPQVIEKMPASEQEKICPVCGEALEHLGWKFVRDEIRIKPAEVTWVKVYAETLHCPECKKESEDALIIQSENYAGPVFDNSIVTASLLAYILYQKYINSMPLYRQERDLGQYGFPVKRATLANWCIRAGNELLAPVYAALKQHLMSREVNSADETTCQVLKEDGRKATQKSYMWLHSTSDMDGLPPIMLFEYQKTRAGYVPKEFYKDFKGRYIMCDGYQGYNSLPDHIIRCACLAHIRRKFYEAIPAEEKKKKVYSSPAARAVNLITELFLKERSFKDLDPETRKIKRLETEPEIWKKLWSWIDGISADKGSALGKAVTYAQNQRPYAENYLKDGRIPISNNFMESCGARPYAIGRKNYYFHDTEKGAETSAIIYSVALTAKYNGLSVMKYLEYVIRYMSDHKDGSADMESIMPWNEEIQKLCSIKNETEPEINS